MALCELIRQLLVRELLHAHMKYDFLLALRSFFQALKYRVDLPMMPCPSPSLEKSVQVLLAKAMQMLRSRLPAPLAANA